VHIIVRESWFYFNPCFLPRSSVLPRNIHQKPVNLSHGPSRQTPFLVGPFSSTFWPHHFSGSKGNALDWIKWSNAWINHSRGRAKVCFFVVPLLPPSLTLWRRYPWGLYFSSRFCFATSQRYTRHFGSMLVRLSSIVGLIMGTLTIRLGVCWFTGNLFCTMGG